VAAPASAAYEQTSKPGRTPALPARLAADQLAGANWAILMHPDNVVNWITTEFGFSDAADLFVLFRLYCLRYARMMLGRHIAGAPA
jgi:hypothetical protein